MFRTYWRSLREGGGDGDGEERQLRWADTIELWATQPSFGSFYTSVRA